MPQKCLRKYGASATVNFTLFQTDGIDFKVDAVHASGDTKIMKDEGAETNTTNAFTDEGTGYSLVLTATEMQAARIVVYIVDQGTKVWLDDYVVIETYGHASAQHAVDLDDGVRAGLTALPNAAADAAGGLPISDAGALDLDAKLANTNEITAARLSELDAGTGGKMAAEMDLVKAALGQKDDTAAAGDPTITDTAIAYLKQLINVLVGSTGVVTFPAEAPPANGASLAEVLRAIHADVTGLNGAAMRGTDSAALASVCTEARLAELDAANLPATTDATLADTADMQPKLGTPAGLDMSADLAAIKADTGATLTDTADMQPKLGAPAADLAADIAAIKTIVDAIVVDTAEIGAAGAGLTALGGMGAGMKAEVNAEVVDVLTVDARGEPSQGAWPVSTSIAGKLDYIYKERRNKKDQDSATYQIYADDGVTVDHKATVSDTGSLATKGELVSGP